MAQAGVRIGALELLFGTVNMNERVLYLQTCTGAAIERIEVRTARQGIIKLDNYLVSLRIWRVVTPKICNRASHSSIPMSLHFSRLQLRDCREMYRKTNPQTIGREGEYELRRFVIIQQQRTSGSRRQASAFFFRRAIAMLLDRVQRHRPHLCFGTGLLYGKVTSDIQQLDRIGQEN